MKAVVSMNAKEAEDGMPIVEAVTKIRRAEQPLPRIGPCQEEAVRLPEANEAKPSRERLMLIRIFATLREGGSLSQAVPDQRGQVADSATAVRGQSRGQGPGWKPPYPVTRRKKASMRADAATDRLLGNNVNPCAPPG